MIVVTGATGKLGHHVVTQLLQELPASELAITARHPDKASALAALGVKVHQADYNSPGALVAALRGADKLLLISSSEVGQRLTQHQTVLRAAVEAGVGQLVYTSILRADSSSLGLAVEHLATERAIVASGLSYVFLRNGWYYENVTEHLAGALAQGGFLGSAGEGRVAAASRADYAAAAVAVLTGSGHDRATYELAGDEGYTMPGLAREVSRQVGKTLGYTDMPKEAYKGILLSVGVPEGMAELLADSDAGVARGELDDHGGALRRLIGRPTTTLAAAISEGLAAASATA
jgi:NAD(P)H dehydrogenase (quinone)